jgi:uncharacterized protein with PIN domain
MKKVTSIRLSEQAEKEIKKIIREQSLLKINRTQAIEIALALHAGPRCPECTTPLEEITVEGGHTGFWRCPVCASGDTFVINQR